LLKTVCIGTSAVTNVGVVPFRDFVLTQIADVRLIARTVKEHEAEYGMESGVLRMRVRAAMAGYLMRRWNVDCTEDHSLKGDEFHLWLRNRQAL
jgi:hypothetical protein